MQRCLSDPKRKVKKYEGPYRLLVHLVSMTSSTDVCKRCLKCMKDTTKKQFEYARQSSDGKEHLKTCKAQDKATTLDGTYDVFTIPKICEILSVLWKERVLHCPLTKHQVSGVKGRSQEPKHAMLRTTDCFILFFPHAEKFAYCLLTLFCI